MLCLPDDLLILCIPPFDSFGSLTEFLALRLVNERFNRVLRSAKFWNLLPKSQIVPLCKLLSSYWYGLRYLKFENLLEEIDQIPIPDKYSIPSEIKRWLILETKITLPFIIKIIRRTKHKQAKFRYALLKKEKTRRSKTIGYFWVPHSDEWISDEFEICRIKCNKLKK